MTHSFKLSRRIARFRLPMIAALAVAFGACDSGNSLSPESTSGTDSPVENQTLGASIDTLGASIDTLAVAPTADGLSLASASWSGGIAFGTFNQPTTWYGNTYNGAKRTIGPYELLSTLSAIRARGGKVVLMLAGSEINYKDASGHFSLTKWKQRIDRFRGINFNAFITDGTIIGHYMIDEPQDATNWSGSPIPPATVEAMGQYSKSRWPGMATIVRAEPRYFPFSPRYVDAAWAQYAARFGDAGTYIRRQVADAQNRGLALVTGMNLIDGGNPKHTPMNASEVKSYGAALLSSSYPCAFISWQHRTTYLSTASIKDAMQYLSYKAKSRSAKSCRS
jgi:hypothetical protein